MKNADPFSKILSVLGPLSVLVVWFVLTNSGIVKPLFFPTPQAVVSSFLDFKMELIAHMGATLLRIIVGYTLGIVAGVSLGLMMSYNKYIFAFFNNIIESWRPIPPVAFIPFFILWFGFSNFGKILMVLFGVALVMVVNTIEAVKNVNPIFLRAAYSLGATKKKVFSSIIFPAIIPELRSGLRISLALSVSLVVVSEFLGAEKGVGYLINVAKVTFNTEVIVMGIFLLGFIAWALDYTLRKTIDYITSWSEQSSDALEKQKG